MKIVSLLPSATEIVCALGLEKDLMAVTHECDFPKSIAHLPAITASRISHETMTIREIDHAVRSQLDGHGSIYALNTELLEKLQPDLILTQELCDDCTVVSLEPNTIEDVFATIRTVGEFAVVSERTTDVITDLNSRLENVRRKV